MMSYINNQMCSCSKLLSRTLPRVIRYYSQTASELSEENATINTKKPSFQQLLDESLLTKFGRPNGKCVVGKITEICNDELYVDFGAKFEAVVKITNNNNAEFYKKGALVRLILNKFEMTGAFLGDPRHITLCEADAALIGPYFDVSTQTNNVK